MADAVNMETPRGSEIAQSSPYIELSNYLRSKGSLVEKGSNHKKWELIKKGYLRTRLSLPVIGDMDYKPIDYQINQEDGQLNPDITIQVTDIDATKRAEKKGSSNPSYGHTTITVADAKNRAIAATIERPNEMWRWLGLDVKTWTSDPENENRFVTKSKDEAEKIVKSFSEMINPFNDPEEDPETRYHSGRVVEEPKFSRRSFLKFVKTGAKLAAIDTVAAHTGIVPRTFTKQFWENLENLVLTVSPDTLRKQLEEQFGIIVGVDKEVPYSTPWDSARLKGLIEALSETPPHFYAPRVVDGKEQKVKFVLSNVNLLDNNLIRHEHSASAYAAYCHCYKAENQIIVQTRIYNGETLLERGRTRDTWFHELTHAVTQPNIQHYIDTIAKPIGIDTQDKLANTFPLLSVITHPSSIPNSIKGGVSGHINLHYGAKSFHEFFSVASEAYSHGKRKFISVYKPLLGKERAEIFYGGMKKEIFKDKEY